MLLFASLALAGSPAESALFRWADKCPSTAMGAGMYHGSDHAVVEVGGREVIRVRTRGAGPAGTPTGTETLWMVAEGCRAVGVVEAGGKSPRAVGFVVAKEGGAPTAEEQATLLAWAGKRDWDATAPDQAAATSAFSPRPAGEAVPEGKLYRMPGRAWRDGAAPAQVAAWRPGTKAPAGAVCPCFEVARPGEGAIVEEGGRWAVATWRPTGGTTLNGTPPAALAGLEAAWMPAPSGPAGVLTVYDPRTGASFVLEAPGPFAWAAGGITYGGGTIEVATVAGWLGR